MLVLVVGFVFCTLVHKLATSFLRIKFHYYKCAVRELEENCVRRLYAIYRESHEITQDDFQRLLSEYTDIVMLRSSLDGSLRGFLQFGKEVRHRHERAYTLLKVGRASFSATHKNLESSMQSHFFIYQYIKERLLHPSRPVYFLNKFTSYTSYMWLVNRASMLYPRSHSKATPELEKTVVTGHEEDCATRPRDEYNLENFAEENGTVNSVADIDFCDGDIDYTHSQFFVEKNHGWKLGSSPSCAVWSFDWNRVWRELAYAWNTQNSSESQKLARKYAIQYVIQQLLQDFTAIIDFACTKLDAARLMYSIMQHVH